VALLRQAHILYERLAAADGMARVRHSMRAAGTRLCHWSHADRPTFGCDSLTDTERRIADLVAQGLSNLNTTQPDAVAIDVDPRSAHFARSAEVAAGPRWKPRPDPPSASEWLAACHGSVRLMPG
jgi:hypothetical protein